jgi:hypothetical protein
MLKPPLQNVGNVLGGLMLLKAEFAEAKDLIDHLLRKDMHLVYHADGLAFQIIELPLGLRP